MFDANSLSETQRDIQVLLASASRSRKTGDWRLVINLKKRNCFIHMERFQMVSLHTILQAVQPGDWMLSVELKDDFLPISILPSFQK